MAESFADQYVEPVTLDLTDDSQRLAALMAIRRLNSLPEYRVQVVQVNADGTTVQDLTRYVVKAENDSSHVKWDCAQNVPGSLVFNLKYDLVWGSSIVMVYQLIRSVPYNIVQGYLPEVYIRFPIGQFVVTTPGFADLDSADYHEVTGYDKNYLLQTALSDAYAFSATSNFGDAVRKLFQGSGVIASTAFLASVCDYPGDWPSKVLGVPLNFTPDTTDNYLTAINQLLAKSGMRAIYVQPNGRWLIETLPVPSTQSTRWQWAGSDGGRATDDDLGLKAVVMHQQSYNGDVWNVPNQWVFVQQGLTFQPIEGSGQYTVNNVGTAPSGQAIVGRVIRSTQYLNASGQADLKTQGDAIVAAQLAQAEKISLTTTPWPVARQFDVFYYLHESLPLEDIRRLQAQSWTLPLWGGLMSWETNAVNVI